MGQGLSVEEKAKQERLAKIRAHLKTVKLVCPRVHHHADQYHHFTEADYPKEDENLVDLSATPYMSAIHDQKNWGACVSFAISYMVEYDMRRQDQSPKDLSRFFLYYNMRKLQGTVNEDSGASVRAGIFSLNHNGICESQLWPYIDNNMFKEPTKDCYEHAGYSKSIVYKRVMPDLNHLRTALNKGYLIAIGVEVYDSYMSDEAALTGIIPIPDKTKESLLGGHSTVLCGYDDNKKLFKFANSWTEHWGCSGYGYYPYDYIINEILGITYDYWTITVMSDGKAPCPDTDGPSMLDSANSSGVADAAISK